MDTRGNQRSRNQTQDGEELDENARVSLGQAKRRFRELQDKREKAKAARLEKTALSSLVDLRSSDLGVSSQTEPTRKTGKRDIKKQDKKEASIFEGPRLRRGAENSKQKKLKADRLSLSLVGSRLNTLNDSYPDGTSITDLGIENYAEPPFWQRPIDPPPVRPLFLFRLQGIPFGLMMPILMSFKSRKELEKLRSMPVVPKDYVKGTNMRLCYLKDQDPVCKKEAGRGNWKRSPMIDMHSEVAIETLTRLILRNVPGDLNPDEWNIEPGFLVNLKQDGATHQDLHLDEPEAFSCKDPTKLPIIVCIPLSREGMVLRFGGIDNTKPVFRYYGLGEACIMRTDVFHAGCYGKQGNLRLRLYLTQKDWVRDVSKDTLYCQKHQKEKVNITINPNDVMEMTQQDHVKSRQTMRLYHYENRLFKLYDCNRVLCSALTANIDVSLIKKSVYLLPD